MFPATLCLLLVGLSALLNLALRLRFPASLRLDQWPAFALLAFDVLQLGGLLYLTGGLDNPFAILLLAPVIVSATTLPPRPTVLLGVLVVVSASFLGVMHWPLPWRAGESVNMELTYTAGVWVALVSACVFTGVYAFRVAEEARQLARALNATEMVLAREHHLSALDGLAAAAAHELGTPLATIALVAKELEREMPPDAPQADDVALLRSQSQRCRDILARITSLSSEGDQHLARLALSHLIEEVVEPYRAFAAKIRVEPPSGEGRAGRPAQPGDRPGPCQPRRERGRFRRGGSHHRLGVDRRRGHHHHQRRRAGLRPRHHRPGRGALHDDRRPGDGGGLGLGFFIAKTLLERSGARLELANRKAPAHGAEVQVAWPRALMDLAAAGAPADAGAKGDRTGWRRALESL